MSATIERAALPAFSALLRWPARRLGLAALCAAATALAVGLPTDVIPNPVFGRTVAVAPLDYLILAAMSILGGLVLASFTAPATCAVRKAEHRSSLLSNVLGFLAVGCPLCNHAAVLVLGSAGALGWFAPVQPLLGLASVGLMAWVLRARLRVSAG